MLRKNTGFAQNLVSVIIVLSSYSYIPGVPEKRDTFDRE